MITFNELMDYYFEDLLKFINSIKKTFLYRNCETKYKIDSENNIHVEVSYDKRNVEYWDTNYQEIKDMLIMKSLNLGLLYDSDMISQAVCREYARRIPFKKYKHFEEFAKSLPHQELFLKS